MAGHRRAAERRSSGIARARSLSVLALGRASRTRDDVRGRPMAAADERAAQARSSALALLTEVGDATTMGRLRGRHVVVVQANRVREAAGADPRTRQPPDRAHRWDAATQSDGNETGDTAASQGAGVNGNADGSGPASTLPDTAEPRPNKAVTRRAWRPAPDTAVRTRAEHHESGNSGNAPGQTGDTPAARSYASGSCAG